MVKILGNILMPDILYKYRDWQSKFHQEILSKQIIYFSSPEDFNDPFDCKIPIRYDIEPEKQLEEIYYRTFKTTYENLNDNEIRILAKKQVHEGLISPKIFKKNGAEYFEKLNQRMGVFSISKHNNDILMWGHYANSHKGFCLGFDTHELLKSKDIDFMGKVHYTSEFPVIIPDSNDFKNNFQKQIFTKWDKWAYEDEYRFTKNHIINRKISLSKSCFKEIIFGYKMEQNERNKIKKIVTKNFPNILIYEAKPNEERFLIEITRIE